MAIYTALNGQIRIYDSTEVLRAAAACKVHKFVSPATYSDITTACSLDDTTYTASILALAVDKVFIGGTSRFARIRFKSNALATGAGALVAHYYNGSTWAVLPCTDGTAVSANCFAQDGYIYFDPPSDWALRGETALDADKYYVRLGTTSNSNPDTDADVLFPVDAQYFEIIFDKMDFSGPTARPRPESSLVMHRGRHTAYTSAILGDDTPILEGQEVSFSVMFDTVVNRVALLEALTCGNPASAYWTLTGTSTKTDTTIVNGDGTAVATPAFADTTNKAVCLQVLYTRDSVAMGYCYNELWIPPDQVTFKEAEDGIVVSIKGLCFGRIEPIYAFGYKY